MIMKQRLMAVLLHGKKWFKEDLGINPKSISGSKTRHLGSAGGFDYEMDINKE